MSKSTDAGSIGENRKEKNIATYVFPNAMEETPQSISRIAATSFAAPKNFSGSERGEEHSEKKREGGKTGKASFQNIPLENCDSKFDLIRSGSQVPSKRLIGSSLSSATSVTESSSYGSSKRPLLKTSSLGLVLSRTDNESSYNSSASSPLRATQGGKVVGKNSSSPNLVEQFGVSDKSYGILTKRDKNWSIGSPGASGDCSDSVIKKRVVEDVSSSRVLEDNNNSSDGGGAKSAWRPSQRPVSKGHHRSISHGGVVAPASRSNEIGFGTYGSGSFVDAGLGSVTTSSYTKPSALKKGHTRAASQGQIVDQLSQGNLKSNRIPSKTDFILPPGHGEHHHERPSIPGVTLRGHSRQASRSESIYTLRQHKPPLKSKLFFWKSSSSEEESQTRIRIVVPNHVVPCNTPSDQHPNGSYPNNHIRTTKYTTFSFLPKNLFEQFHRFANLYFISIVLLNWIPAINAFGKEIAMLPVMFVLGVTAIKDMFEDLRRHNSDKRINNSLCRVWNREIGRYAQVQWKDLHVGDIVHLSCNEVIPADILVLKTSDPNGVCYIDTMNLDGENNLKQREVARGFFNQQINFTAESFDNRIEIGAPTTKIYHFSGNIIHGGGKYPVTKENLLLRDCVLKNTDFVEGIIVYAGRETKAMLNNGGPRHKRTGLEKIMNVEVIWCVVILVVLCLIGATGAGLWSTSFQNVPFAVPSTTDQSDVSPFVTACLTFLTFVIILQVMIPLSLYVTIEITKLMQVYHIQNDIHLYDDECNKRIECRAMNITEDLGHIQYIFSDKTGTLTENKMLFRRCTIGGIDYGHNKENENLAAKLASKQVPQIPGASGPRFHLNSSLAELIHSEIPGIKMKPMVSQASNVDDFFKVLALCNTVVVAKHPHHDQMNLAGEIEPETASSDTLTPQQLHQYARLSPIHESDYYSLTRKNIDKVETNPSGHQYSTSMQTTCNSTINVMPSTGEINKGKVQMSGASSNPCSSSSLLNTKSSQFEDCCNLPVLLNQTNSKISNIPSASPYQQISPPNAQLKTSSSNFPSKRLRLDLKAFRPLSPISSSSETTPTESPAQRPRFLQIPQISMLTRFTKTFQMGQNSGTCSPTPSPASEHKPIFEAESPDELALVEASYAYNYKLLKRTPQTVKISLPGEGSVEYEVLQTFPFDSVRKRMSVILRNTKSDEIVLYTKGADSAILSRLKHTMDRTEAEIVRKTQTNINNYSREGLRTLVMCKKRLTELEYRSWLMKYEEAEREIDNRDRLMFECYNYMESELELVGATGIEDSLQEGVPETIESLRKAGIVVWVLTGDKQETAINIAYSCKLFSPSMDIIKINARSKDAAEETISFYLREAENIDKEFKNLMSISNDDCVEVPSDRANNILASFSSSLCSNHQSASDPFANFPGSQMSQGEQLSALNSKDRALVIDGRTLTYILDPKTKMLSKFLSLTKMCSSVLCCRSTPLQKAFIVSSVKEQLGMRTLAIGDGANDVSMIQRADVGIGISGKEGMQAVMASDFAISKFRYLERLLLVHGHWCYDRLARMILYFFYKNAAFVFVIFWYQLFNGWSGSIMIDQMYLMVYNLFFTALPPMAIGIYDQDAPADLLLSTPILYKLGRLKINHQAHSFWLNMLDSLYQSIVIFFMSYGAFNGSNVGTFEFGTTVVVSCLFSMLIHMAIEAKSWSMIHVLSIVLSILFFYGFAFVYNSVCINCLGFENPFWVIHGLIASPIHWLIVVITAVVAVLPRLSIRCLQTSLFPSDIVKILIQKRRKKKPDESFFVSWSRSSSTSSVMKEQLSFACCGRNHVSRIQSRTSHVKAAKTSSSIHSVASVS